MDKVSSRLLVVLVFALWAIIGLSGYFNVSDSNNTSTSAYHVADSTFEISNWWSFINHTNNSIMFDNYKSMPYNSQGRGNKKITLNLIQYTTSSEFESEFENLKVLSANVTVLNTNITNIAGIKIRVINSTDTNSTTHLDYFFEKNGKYYSINIAGASYTVNELYDNAIRSTVETVISTIN